MRAEDDDGTDRHRLDFVDEYGSATPQIVDDVTVMDDLMEHEHGRAVDVERAVDDVDRADDPRTKAARLCEEDFHQVPVATVPASAGAAAAASAAAGSAVAGSTAAGSIATFTRVSSG